MSIIKTNLDGVDVVMESVNFSNNGTGMVDTFGSIPESRVFDKVMDKMEPVIRSLAVKGSGALYGIENRPDEMELSFSMGYSAEMEVWVLKGSGELTFNVSMKWNNK